MAKPTLAPTPQQFAAYQRLFAHFNRELFGGALPPVLLNFSRKSKAAGFFAPARWARREAAADEERTHEISINPETLSAPLVEAADTLVHEMVHLWQREHGKPSRAGYHNRQWAEKMRAIGLEPVSLDSDNGTGQRVGDRPIPGGPFLRAFEELPAAARLPLVCAAEVTRPKKPRADKVKYTCPECGVNVWGKAGLSVICGECGCEMEA